MNCKERRTIYNLFKIFDCQSCNSFIKDEEFVVGRRKVNIYYSINKCKLDDFIDFKESIYFNKKIKMFLKDAILNQGNILVLWLDEDIINNDIIELLLEFDLDIHIMKNC